MSSSLEESKRTYFQVPLYSEMDSPGSPRSQISKIHKLIKNLSLVLQQCSTAGTAGRFISLHFATHLSFFLLFKRILFPPCKFPIRPCLLSLCCIFLLILPQLLQEMSEAFFNNYYTVFPKRPDRCFQKSN